MSFLKSIAEVIVRSQGYSIPSDMKNNNINNKKGDSFSLFLNGKRQQLGLGSSMQLPVPPTPPANLDDPKAQKEYNQALFKYNQDIQSYNLKILSLFSQRFSMMQQAILQSQQAKRNEEISARNSSGIGGILESDTTDI